MLVQGSSLWGVVGKEVLDSDCLELLDFLGFESSLRSGTFHSYCEGIDEFIDQIAQHYYDYKPLITKENMSLSMIN